MQLPDSTHAEISALCKQGDDLARAGHLEESKNKYVAALRLLPENHREWEAATWIYAAVGDVHFQMKNYDKAFKCFYNAAQCPKGLGNPYIHLRLGQLYYEQERLDQAADELTRAYMGAGIAIFMEDDPKYLEFLETRIAI
ncbi:tetratricopeptide repeat protein [Cohnella xylanilytica]|uniref:Tetratricopeptide repeat protein n=1 Tax=Cohnella xylanilytica TaxID=557555 RepID=A0A841TSI2_9BACL|nr:tetratricopeptide repeat protein [Cohnella xylanilytica]MBB6690068.1 tetratricopeptide repeat protein [Cohnella xylanilytica]